MKFIKKWSKFITENTLAPAKPKIAPPIEKPVPPIKPERKDRTIKEPKVKPGPKAVEKLAEEVAYTFVAEMSKVGQSVKKFIKL